MEKKFGYVKRKGPVGPAVDLPVVPIPTPATAVMTAIPARIVSTFASLYLSVLITFPNWTSARKSWT